MGIDLYPALIHEGDLSPDSFGEEVDAICNEIKEATFGWGTDENRLVQAMGSQTAEVRCKVHLRYEQLFGEKLVDVIEKETREGKPLGQALTFLAVDPLSAECMMIKKAIEGIGTKEFFLLTLLAGRSNKEIDLLKKQYFKMYDEDLGRALDAELRGDLESLVFNVIQAVEEEFDAEVHTEDKMKEDAETLHEMGQGRMGTNEKGIFKILIASPAEYLKDLNMAYAEKYGFTLEKALEEELNGYAEDGASLILGMKLKPYETVAKLVKKSTKGFGTNELLLTSVLIRFQPIMMEVMAAHKELYGGKSIQDRIEAETRGDYEALLKAVVAAGDTTVDA